MDYGLLGSIKNNTHKYTLNFIKHKIYHISFFFLYIFIKSLFQAHFQAMTINTYCLYHFKINLRDFIEAQCLNESLKLKASISGPSI